MALSNSPSENQSQLATSVPLSKEAQERVDTFATRAIDLLKKNPQIQEIITNLLNENTRIQTQKQPWEILAWLNKYEKNFEERLLKLTPDEIKQAKNTHIKFLDTACNFINSCAQNIQWDDQFKATHGEYINKKESFNWTYHTIQNNLYSEITGGKPFPTTKTA